MKQLETVARRVRQRVLEMHHNAHDSHIGCAMSSVDILTALFFGVMNINPKLPLDPRRDRIVLSKGHAASALYAVMCERGFFSAEAIKTFAQNGSTIPSHVERGVLPGVETTGGSGGHGLSIGTGMALASLIDNRRSRIFVVMGDGELQEGSVWEALMFASSRCLSNLTLIVDCNEYQTWARVNDVVAIEPLVEKFMAFGCAVNETDGNDIESLMAVLGVRHDRHPHIVIARTVKGKGVSFMEGKGDWHNSVLTEEQYEKARKELADA